MAALESDLLLPKGGKDADVERRAPPSGRFRRLQHSYPSAGRSSGGCSCYAPLLVLAGMGIAVSIMSFFRPIILDQQGSMRSGSLSTASLPLPNLLGKSKDEDKRKKKKKKKISVLDDAYDCESDPSYSKHTLKRAYDIPYVALFRDNRGQSKFEASDVTIVDKAVYSVCDSSWAISKFARDGPTPFSSDNVQVGDPNRVPGEDSGYEAIFKHGGLFYAW